MVSRSAIWNWPRLLSHRAMVYEAPLVRGFVFPRCRLACLSRSSQGGVVGDQVLVQGCSVFNEKRSRMSACAAPSRESTRSCAV